jgi:hypothetical protein
MDKTTPKMNRSECGDGLKRVIFFDYLELSASRKYRARMSYRVFLN